METLTVINNYGTIIRKNPDTMSAALKGLDIFDKVYLIEIMDDWYKVMEKKDLPVVGYVKKEHMIRERN